MIKIDVSLNPKDVVPDIVRYDREVGESLAEVEALIPNHKEGNFNRRLWKYFKKEIWKQQHGYCGYCEKEIAEQRSELEHFRPKCEVRDLSNKLITRKSYWWLAYDCKNYLVSCATCNNQKWNKFPLKDEKKRVTDKEVALTDSGRLNQEEPLLLNPRFVRNPESSFEYELHTGSGRPLVRVKALDEKGQASIEALDLNRENVNRDDLRDQLPMKRGDRLMSFLGDLSEYEKHLGDLNNAIAVQHQVGAPNLARHVDRLNSIVDKKIKNLKEQFLSSESEFAGLCRWWGAEKTDHGHELALDKS